MLRLHLHDSTIRLATPTQLIPERSEAWQRPVKDCHDTQKVNLKCKASAFERLPPHQLLERVESSQGLEGCTGTGMGEQCSLSMPEQKHITVKVTMVVSLNEALQ